MAATDESRAPPTEIVTNNSPNNLTMDHKPLNIATPEAPLPAPILNRAVDDSALSRALKRKFTELEEITQRLRARLFDVTGNMIIDPDDQFENDFNLAINTIPDEGDDNFEETNMASKMSLDWLEHCHHQATIAAAAEKIKAIHDNGHHNYNQNDRVNALSTAQMRDIFEYLSTSDSNQSHQSFKEIDVEQSIDSLPDKLHSRFSEVINEEQSSWSKASSIGNNSVEKSIDNIAETLQKSLIND